MNIKAILAAAAIAAAHTAPASAFTLTEEQINICAALGVMARAAADHAMAGTPKERILSAVDEVPVEPWVKDTMRTTIEDAYDLGYPLRPSTRQEVKDQFVHDAEGACLKRAADQ
ncbi:MAG: hypothetical protein LC676_11000 [Loktanella sp.]|nr:hypothetical protein [Loktanella sp.]